MNRPKQIEQLMSKGEVSPFINISMSLMSNLNMSFEEVKNLPIPLALEYMKVLHEENKKLEKQMKHGRRHTH